MNEHSLFIAPPLHPTTGWTSCLRAPWQAEIQQGWTELSSAQPPWQMGSTQLTWSHHSSTNPSGFSPPRLSSAHTHTLYPIRQPDLQLRNLKTHTHVHTYTHHVSNTQPGLYQLWQWASFLNRRWHLNSSPSSSFIYTTKNKNRLTAWHLLLWLDRGSSRAWGLCNWRPAYVSVSHTVRASHKALNLLP